jgi:hypothetical protein
MITILDLYSQLNKGDLNDHVNEHENVNFVNNIICYYDLKKLWEKWLRPQFGFANLAVLIVWFKSEEKWASRKE